MSQIRLTDIGKALVEKMRRSGKRRMASRKEVFKIYTLIVWENGRQRDSCEVLVNESEVFPERSGYGKLTV